MSAINVNYLCIDDQKDSTVDTLLESIRRAGGPKFRRETPVEVGTQLNLIANDAKDNPGGFGLLLDLRLDMEADSAGNKVPYRGPTLAQELRTRMAEGQLPFSFPIVLWSIATRIDKSYRGEDTSHDLFDAVYEKDKEIIHEPERVAKEMLALVDGYRRLCEGKNNGLGIAEVLVLENDGAPGVYYDFLDELEDAFKSNAIHYPARIIITQLIKFPGLLVNEALLCARLGLDSEASGTNWSILKDMLASAVYRGPFDCGWARWWWPKIEDWWENLDASFPNWRRTPAAERVELLNRKLGLQLIAAKPMFDTYSDKFTSLCAATKKPLDPVDGFRVANFSKKNWQDVSYVSIHAAINRINKAEWGRVHPMDRDRFDSLKGRGINE